MRPNSTCQNCAKPFHIRPSTLARGYGKFCSRPCFYEFQRKNVEQRFWDKVEQTPTCWLWTGSSYPFGYGQFAFNGSRSRRAHRVAWILTHGEIPEGMNVLHRCDNNMCVRPDHLFLGSQADNVHDMIQKGRDGYSKWPHYRGEQSHSSKLSAKDVQQIRELLREGRMYQYEIARQFNVGTTTISRIKRGETWSDID